MPPGTTTPIRKRAGADGLHRQISLRVAWADAGQAGATPYRAKLDTCKV